MPDLTSLASTFRAGRFRYRLYLSYLPQTVVLAASVNGSPDYSGGSIQTLTVDNVTAGSVAACLDGQTVEIQSSAGVHKGFTRVAVGGGSGAVVQIAELSAGTIDIADDDLVIVYQDYRIWDKLVSATTALNKDSRLAYTDQGANPNPICNSGGPIVGWTSGGTLSANFYGSTSRVIDPDSAGTITHSWAFPGATPSSSTDADPTGVAFPAGEAVFATHTATDAGNSKASKQYIPVWAHSADYPPIELSRARLFYAEQDGWSAEFQVADDDMASAALMPDGCLVVIWYQAYYSDTAVAYGANVTGRSHIRFVGYLDRANTRLEPEGSETLFNAISPLGVLARTPTLPQITIQKNTPTKWRHLKTNTVHRTLWYLWYWHNTAFNLFDFITPSTGDLQYKRLAAGVTGNQLEQYRDIAASLNWLTTCDRLGRLITQTDPQLLDSTARAARTTVYDYALADLLSAEWEEPYHWQSKTVVGEGITDGLTTSANKPVFARAPGTAPATRGTGVETLDKQIVDHQTDINERTGLQFAKVNSLYNGRVVPRGMGVSVPDGYGFIDPAYLEYATFTIPATSNARATAFDSTMRWLFRNVDETYIPDGGAININATVDHETLGSDANKEIRRQPNQSGLPPFPPFNFDFPGFDLPPIVIGSPIVGSGQNLALFGDDGYVYRTADAQTPAAAGGPTFTRTDLSVTGTAMNYMRDNQSPLYIGSGTAVNGWLVTSTDIYRVSDVFGSVGAASQHTFTVTTDLVQRQIFMGRGVANWVIVISEYSSTQGAEIAYTTDGTNWTEVNVGGAFVSTTGEGYSGIAVSSKVPGKAYVFAYSADDTARVYRTLNYGVSWSLLSPAAVAGLVAGGAVFTPFNGNPADNLLYIGGIEDSSSTGARLYRGLAAGSKADITPEESGVKYSAIHGISRLRIAASALNRQRMILCGRSADGQQAIFNTVDGGSTWTLQLSQPAGGLPIDYDADYWLSRPYAVNLAHDGSIVFLSVDLETYAGGVGILSDLTSTRVGGNSTHDVRYNSNESVSSIPDPVYGGNAQITANAGLQRHVHGISGIGAAFPAYSYINTVATANITGGSPPTAQWRFSEFDLTLTGTVRVIVEKATQPFPGYAVSAAYNSVEISSVNDNIAWFFGLMAFGATSDFGATIDDRMGNIAELSSTVTFVGLCEGSVS